MSQSLWSRYDRHFVGITLHNASTYMAKIYRVIQVGLGLKLNQVENVHTMTDLPKSLFKHHHSDKHLSEFLPTRWRQKSTGIDTEQNYVTVTLCICTAVGLRVS